MTDPGSIDAVRPRWGYHSARTYFVIPPPTPLGQFATRRNPHAGRMPANWARLEAWANRSPPIPRRQIWSRKCPIVIPRGQRWPPRQAKRDERPGSSDTTHPPQSIDASRSTVARRRVLCPRVRRRNLARFAPEWFLATGHLTRAGSGLLLRDALIAEKIRRPGAMRRMSPCWRERHGRNVKCGGGIKSSPWDGPCWPVGPVPVAILPPPRVFPRRRRTERFAPRRPPSLS